MDIQNKKSITLDLRQNTLIPLPQFIQNDNNIIEFDIKDNGAEADLTNIGRIVVNYKRPDKVVISRLAEVVSGNVIYNIGVDEQNVAGHGELEIQFFSLDDTERISTKRMKVYMIESIGTDEIYTNDDDYTVLQDLFIEVDTVKTDAETATTNANNAATNANNAADTTKLVWKGPVTTYADLPATKSLGDTYQVENDGTASNNGMWRWDGAAWVKINSPQAYDSRIITIENNLSLQEDQVATLVHGINAIFSDMGSSLKVEFEGITKVNLLGKDGNFESLTPFSTSGTVALSTTQKKSGSNSLKVTSSGSSSYAYKDYSQSLDTAKYYLVGGWAFVESYTSGSVGIYLCDSGTVTARYSAGVDTSKVGTWQFVYVKVPASNTLVGSGFRLFIGTRSSPTAVVYFDDIYLYTISETTFNEIGVLEEYTGDKLAEKFPYIDSVKSVKNVFAKVSGSQLLDSSPNYRPERLTVNSPYNFTINENYPAYDLEVVANTDYFYEHKGTVKYLVHGLNSDGSLGSALTGTYTATGKAFNSGSYKNIRIYYEGVGSTVDEPMLNLGDTAKPFTEKNDSYLYAETVLAGNDNKKDILSRNYDLNRWEKIKWWETDVVLDGSLAWAFNADYTGFKRVRVPMLNAMSNDLTITSKYDGSILQYKDSHLYADRTSLASDLFYISISDTDSGWLEAWTGTELTADFIKSYFYGWKYTGDGTTHSWVSLVDGSAPSTNTLAYVSANMAPNFTPYELTYQLAKSTVEPVTVEGDLSISGDAQVEVGEGVIVREEATTVYGASYDKYYINMTGHGVIADNPLKHKVDKIIHVYKNGEIDDNNWEIYSSYAYGNERLQIDANLFDTTATYTVTYEVLDKYDFTTNIQEVTANYASSLKSSFQRNQEQTSDNTTAISILDRLKANKAQEQWIAPTLLNGWVNYNTVDFNSAGYYLDDFGNIHLKGMLKSGTTSQGTVLLTLPKGYRPKKLEWIPTFSDDGTSVLNTIIRVGANGDVVLYESVGNTWLTLDGISFRAEQ